ncbi:MAG: restriction endonuclease subunit R, partial [Chitinophagaceae bacterium]
VVYNTDAQPHMLVECKEMNVPLSDKTMVQLLSYNSAIRAAMLVVTNGSFCIAFGNDKGATTELSFLPMYSL